MADVKGQHYSILYSVRGTPVLSVYPESSIVVPSGVVGIVFHSEDHLFKRAANDSLDLPAIPQTAGPGLIDDLVCSIRFADRGIFSGVTLMIRGSVRSKYRVQSTYGIRRSVKFSVKKVRRSVQKNGMVVIVIRYETKIQRLDRVVSGSDSGSFDVLLYPLSLFFFFFLSLFAFNHATYSPGEGSQIGLEEFIIFEQCVSVS